MKSIPKAMNMDLLSLEYLRENVSNFADLVDCLCKISGENCEYSWLSPKYWSVIILKVNMASFLDIYLRWNLLKCGECGWLSLVSLRRDFQKCMDDIQLQPKFN